MAISGCLFDFTKLNDVSKNVLSRMTADEIYEKFLDWAEQFDADFASCLKADPAKAKAIFAIGRGGKKPRKDFTTWQDVKPYMDLFYNDTFHNVDEIPEQYSTEDVKNSLSVYLENSTDFADNNAWFEYVKSVAKKSGFCPDVKLYKQSPESYKGHVGDVSTFVRLAVAGKLNSPDLFEIIRIIGREEADNRIKKFIENC
jgi:glutamyl-tRNA synthetase